MLEIQELTPELRMWIQCGLFRHEVGLYLGSDLDKWCCVNRALAKGCPKLPLQKKKKSLGGVACLFHA